MSNTSVMTRPRVEAEELRQGARLLVQGTAWRAAAGAARRLAAWHARRRQIDRTVDALSGLSDHMLKDIGIHRSEILSIAHSAGDPTRSGR